MNRRLRSVGALRCFAINVLDTARPGWTSITDKIVDSGAQKFLEGQLWRG